ncbi:hypothetical protein BBC27_08345 [Acidithiobacillus ferrivorans]|uniref:Uncharacterized protein n=1 Tax=Acidithiobacillus ferrivorans TaxID=160808 RepID=A0A1B9C059_9PROT|nr:hypothetical protein [Acidithiobacillus ferrivorans]OCB03349.1 hypothetical protein BBC27_08345 [Acidithiobacillus ferrivorans]
METGEILTFYCRYVQELDELAYAIDQNDAPYVDKLLEWLPENEREVVLTQTNEVFSLVEAELHLLWSRFADGLRKLPIGREIKSVRKQDAPWSMDWWVSPRRVQVSAIIDYDSGPQPGLRSCIWMKGGASLEAQVCRMLADTGAVTSSEVTNFMAGCVVFPPIPLLQADDSVDIDLVVVSLLEPYRSIGQSQWNAIQNLVPEKHGK